MTVAEIIDEFDGATRQSFAAFVDSCPFWSYQQTPAWLAAVPAHPRHHYLAVICRRDDAIIGSAVVRRSKLAGPYWLASSARGPLVRDPADLGEVIRAIGDVLRDTGAATWQLAPRVRGRDLPAKAEAMRAAGATPLPASQQSLHVATGIVWLDKPEDDILAGFGQSGRRKLKAATKAGVQVRAVESEADIAAFQRALDIFDANRPAYEMSSTPDAKAQAGLIEELGGAMLLAEKDGVLLGAASYVHQGGEAIWLTLASTDAEPKIPSNYLLLWEAMRRARASGCVGYDLAGVPIDEPSDPGEKGRMQFKNAFRPHRRVMLPMHSIALKPVAHSLLFTSRQLVRSVLK
ncbi:MAG: hypothetical protein CMN74_05190 [Sphingorhabdus sp.]|nr:hypothetical protein [Sphingorhabdus sp.]